MPCKSILIVEDDLTIRETLQQALEIEGYQVYAAADGKEAIDTLPKMPSPCLILLDLMMPIMNGFEFLKIKKKDVLLAPIPVVVVSAFKDKEELLEKGETQGFLKKPIDMELLLKLVKKYCD